MARNNATPIQGVLDRVVAEAEAAAVELEARRAELLEQLRSTTDELRRLTKVVNAAQPSEAKLKRRDTRTGRQPSIAPERLELIRGVIKRMDGPITAPDVASASKGKVTQYQAGKALYAMREQGEVRFTGYERAPGVKGKGRKRYALVS